MPAVLDPSLYQSTGPEILVTEAQLRKAEGIEPGLKHAFTTQATDGEDAASEVASAVEPAVTENGTGTRRRAFPRDDQAMQELFQRLRGPAHSVRDGDRASLRDRLVLAHTSLVEHCARAFVATAEPIEDLVQEGYIGLIKAVDRYDPNKGVRFSTYACHLISGEMRHYLRDLGKLIHEPGWHAQLRLKVVRKSESLLQKLGRPPQIEEIASMLNIEPHVVRAVLDTHNVLAVESLDAPTGENDEGSSTSHEDRAVAGGTPHTTQVENHMMLDAALPQLRALEQKAIRLFYYQEKSKTEIARELGISVNYASYLVKRGVENLRRVVEESEALQEATATVEASRYLTVDDIAAWVERETTKTRQYALVFFRIDNWGPATARLSAAQRQSAEEAVEAITRRCSRLSDKVVPVASTDGSSLCFVALLFNTDKRAQRVGERWADSCTSREAYPANPALVDALLCDYAMACAPADGATAAEVVKALLDQL